MNLRELFYIIRAELQNSCQIKR